MNIPAVFYTLKSYFQFLRHSKNEYSLHSPFVYNLYTKVLKKATILSHHKAIDEVRNALLKDNRIISFETFGVPSRANAKIKQKVKSIAKNSLKERKNAIRIAQLINHFNYKHLIELGTSFGITTAYMAHGKKEEKSVTTFEGNRAIAEIARANFQKLGLENIQLLEGNIDQTLLSFLETSAQIDFALIDANHAYEPTMRYFKLLQTKMSLAGCIMIDDIYWSEEMTKAWKEIIAFPEVTVSIDFFDFGLVFFRKEQVKEHFVLRL